MLSVSDRFSLLYTLIHFLASRAFLSMRFWPFLGWITPYFKSGLEPPKLLLLMLQDVKPVFKTGGRRTGYHSKRHVLVHSFTPMVLAARSEI